MLDFSRTWLPFLYLYGVGGIAFSLGIYLITKTKALNIYRNDHLLWLAILFFGFFYYASIHRIFISLALMN